METDVGRYGDSLAHLSEMRELGERFANAWLTAASRVALGTAQTKAGRHPPSSA